MSHAQKGLFKGFDSSFRRKSLYLLYGSYPSPSPWRPGSVGVRKPFHNTSLIGICQVVFSCNRVTMDFQRTWDSVEKTLPLILHRTLLLTRILWSALGLSVHPPTSARQCFDPKRTHFHSFCSKFNVVWGGRGKVHSFTNITRKVPTLLMSIIEFLARWTEKLSDCVLYCLPHLFNLPAVQQRI